MLSLCRPLEPLDLKADWGSKRPPPVEAIQPAVGGRSCAEPTTKPLLKIDPPAALLTVLAS